MERRNFLKNTALTGLGLSTLPVNAVLARGASGKAGQPGADQDYTAVKPQILAPNGAIYIPATAYNTWQQWQEYDHEVTQRDFGYAKSIGLNSLRIWLSYEYWLEDPKRHESCLEQMLRAAEQKKLKILLALFDSCGVDNTPTARRDKDPKTAVAVMSPELAIGLDQRRWTEPALFVDRIMELHGDDPRLLAIEVMNEPPFKNNRLAMSRYLFKAAKVKQKSVPLTIGSLPGFQNWGNFMDLDIDILQYHDNFPASLDGFKNGLQMAKEVAENLGRPLWITEWQRLRPDGNGWDEQKLATNALYPDFKSLAATVRTAGIGNYFWSLMVKPAYLTPQRKIGTINGLFYEDGAVYSLEDARAIANNPDFVARERKE